MNIDVALADPVVLLLVWVALPVTFAGAAWFVSGRVRSAPLLLLWGVATIISAALGAWLAQPADTSIGGARWPGLGEAFVRSAFAFGTGLAAIALLTRRQRARGAPKLTIGLVLRSVFAFAGVVLLLFFGTVAFTAARELSHAPNPRALAV